MVEWDTRGLPPVAQERLRRASVSHVRTSLLSAPAATAIQHVGFDAVGEVMGCIVQHIGWGGYGCGVYTGFGTASYAPPTQTSGGGGYGGYAPYASALYAGYETSLRRCLLEAQALGADGVVDIRWTQQPLGDGGNREFVALGTAVRARSRSRPAHLFSTDLPGQDVAKLLTSGWVPAGLVVGIAVAIRHDDYRTRSQASSWSRTNLEVDGYTELVSHVRADARLQFAQRAARQGGDSAIVSGMVLDVFEIEPSDNHRDHVAQSLTFGTAVAQFGSRRTPQRHTLTMLPLTQHTDRRTK